MHTSGIVEATSKMMLSWTLNEDESVSGFAGGGRQADGCSGKAARYRALLTIEFWRASRGNRSIPSCKEASSMTKMSCFSPSIPLIKFDMFRDCSKTGRS